MSETGDYTIYYFNYKGAKLKDLTETCKSITVAHEIAKEVLTDESNEWKAAVSYKVDRNIFNSLDTERW